MRFFRLEGHVSDSKVCAIGTDVGLRQCEPACVAQHSVAGCAGHACLSGDDARQMVHLLPLSASLQWAEVVSCSDASESGCCATWSTWPREDVCRGFGDVSLRLTLESRRASRRRGTMEGRGSLPTLVATAGLAVLSTRALFFSSCVKL